MTHPCLSQVYKTQNDLIVSEVPRCESWKIIENDSGHCDETKNNQVVEMITIDDRDLTNLCHRK